MTGINLKVLSCHFSHKTGRLATEGNYEGAAKYATSCISDLEGVFDYPACVVPNWLASIIDSIPPLSALLKLYTHVLICSLKSILHACQLLKKPVRIDFCFSWVLNRMLRNSTLGFYSGFHGNLDLEPQFSLDMDTQ